MIDYTKPVSLYYTDDWHAYTFLDIRGQYVVISKDKGKPKSYEDPVFLKITVLPNSEQVLWPIKYDLDVYDSEYDIQSYVAIQPIFGTETIGFCTSLEDKSFFNLLFITPRSIAESMESLSLSSVQGILKWQKNE